MGVEKKTQQKIKELKRTFKDSTVQEQGQAFQHTSEDAHMNRGTNQYQHLSNFSPLSCTQAVLTLFSLILSHQYLLLLVAIFFSSLCSVCLLLYMICYGSTGRQISDKLVSEPSPMQWRISRSRSSLSNITYCHLYAGCQPSFASKQIIILEIKMLKNSIYQKF